MAGLARTIVALFILVLACDAFAQPVVGILGIAAEIAPIERRLENSREVIVQGYVFRAGALNGRQVVVGRSGAGKVNAAIITTLLVGEFTPVAVIFSGTAGAIDPDLQPGDVVVGSAVVQHDVGLPSPDGVQRRGVRNPLTGVLDPLIVPTPEPLLLAARRAATTTVLPPFRTPFGEELTSKIVEGVIATGDLFLADVTLRETLRSALNASVVEMEGAAVVQTCRQFNVPCLVIRSVTDRADPHAMTNYQAFLAIASEHAAALTVAVVGAIEYDR